MTGPLRPRERTLLADYARYGSVARTARRRRCAESTVKNELSKIYRILGATGAAQALWMTFVDPGFDPAQEDAKDA